VVHIYAEEAALAAELDPSMDGTETETETETGQTVAPSECDHDTTAEPASTDEAPPAPVVSQSETRSKAEGRFNPRPRNTMAPAPDAGTGVEENFSDSGTTDEPAASAESVGEADPRVTSAEAEQDSSPGPIPPAAVRRPPPGIIVGFGDVPAPLIAALLAKGATARTLKPPGIDPEPQYRPLTALDEWVRARDLTCRFPNCDRPAEICDWDHTVPWPAGPTHASGGKLMCRIHHLRKTFWPGWSDVQHPDGTVVWTTPTGRTYTTKPGAQLFFPSVNTTSAPIATGTPKPNTADTMAMMPKRRKRNRAKERASRITAERALNDAHVAEVNNPPF
jgi:hypothetical protein